MVIFIFYKQTKFSNQFAAFLSTTQTKNQTKGGPTKLRRLFSFLQSKDMVSLSGVRYFSFIATST